MNKNLLEIVETISLNLKIPNITLVLKNKNQIILMALIKNRIVLVKVEKIVMNKKIQTNQATQIVQIIQQIKSH